VSSIPLSPRLLGGGSWSAEKSQNKKH